jgi:hypothetical protein
MISSVEYGCARCTPLVDQVGLYDKYRDSCRNEFPAEWKEDIEKISSWALRAKGLYKHRVIIRLIDAQSFIGVWKQLRYRAFKLPAFIVGGKKACAGWNTELVERMIDQQIGEACATMAADKARSR